MKYFRTNFNHEETGRSMVEIIAVLSIMGILAIGGLYGYSLLQEKREENELANQIALNAIRIKTAIQSDLFEDKESFDKFLAKMTTSFRNYTLSYRSSDSLNQTYIMEITDKDGDYIKGKKCRQILQNLSNNKETTNVSFTVDNADTQTEERVWLAGKAVSLIDICGG